MLPVTESVHLYFFFTIANDNRISDSVGEERNNTHWWSMWDSKLVFWRVLYWQPSTVHGSLLQNTLITINELENNSANLSSESSCIFKWRFKSSWQLRTIPQMWHGSFLYYDNKQKIQVTIRMQEFTDRLRSELVLAKTLTVDSKRRSAVAGIVRIRKDTEGVVSGLGRDEMKDGK